MVPLVHTGGKTILCSAFDLDETFALIDSGAVTHYVGVPTMYQMLQADARYGDGQHRELIRRSRPR